MPSRSLFYPGQSSTAPSPPELSTARQIWCPREFWNPAEEYLIFNISRWEWDWLMLTCVAMMFWQCESVTELRREVRLQLNIISGKYSHRKERDCPPLSSRPEYGATLLWISETEHNEKNIPILYCDKLWLQSTFYSLYTLLFSL